MSDRVTIPPHRRRARPARPAAARGFTLVETMLAMVILAFSVAALLQTIGAGQMQTYQALHEARAVAVNDAMLDELLSVDYGQLDAWHGHSQAPDDLADAFGERYPEAYQRFEQTVAVEPHTVELPGFGTVAGKRITITLRDDRAGEWVVHRFVRAPHGSGDEMEEIDP